MARAATKKTVPKRTQRGRPEPKIDWKKVDMLLEAGCDGTQIAAYLGIHPNTLYRNVEKEKGCNFSDYLHTKRSRGDSLLLTRQYDLAVNDKDRTMLIWLGKQRLEQKDKHEASGDMNIKIEVVRVGEDDTDKTSETT